MRIIIGADHGGYQLKATIISFLRKEGFDDVVDIGTNSADSVDYPVYGLKVARAVAAGEADRGILVCGSGIGMCMSANRIPGARAAAAYEPFAAKMSRRHNNCNILCLGERFTGRDLALEIVSVWLREEFEGGRHARRTELLDQ